MFYLPNTDNTSDRFVRFTNVRNSTLVLLERPDKSRYVRVQTMSSMFDIDVKDIVELMRLVDNE